MRLVLTTAQRYALENEARQAFPEECCGLLAGRKIDDEWRVERIVPSLNVTSGDRQQQFEIDPSIRIRLERNLRGVDLAVTGHYHSHPMGCAAPSETDLKSAFEPSLIWLIIAVDSSGTSDIGAFRLNPAGDGFEKLDLVIS